MELNSCWANFCAVKIAVKYVYCYCCKGKHEFVVAGKKKEHGKSGAHLSPTALWCKCPGGL